MTSLVKLAVFAAFSSPQRHKGNTKKIKKKRMIRALLQSIDEVNFTTNAPSKSELLYQKEAHFHHENGRESLWNAPLCLLCALCAAVANGTRLGADYAVHAPFPGDVCEIRRRNVEWPHQL